MKKLSYAEVQKKWKTAWNRLPNSYRADHCLTFYSSGKHLEARADFGEIYVWESSSRRWLLNGFSDSSAGIAAQLYKTLYSPLTLQDALIRIGKLENRLAKLEVGLIRLQELEEQEERDNRLFGP